MILKEKIKIKLDSLWKHDQGEYTCSKKYRKHDQVKINNIRLTFLWKHDQGKK